MRCPSSSSAAGAFARRFRLLMSYHDLTLREIATATHSAVSTVGTWRNGRVPSSRQTLEQLAEVFRVNVEYLIEGRDGRRAGRPTLEEVNDAAGRILEDLDILLSALESHRRKALAPAVKERKKRGQVRP
ncbi:MAG TPA: helix-turn-helix transcriptional regulator [Opitutales bacterium]|nr:helix-turn-helix transcriptional regulator [Opitutales bacterium]